MTTRMDYQDDHKIFSSRIVKPLLGMTDFARWKRNAKAYLVHQDPSKLGLMPAPMGNTAAERRAWNHANALAKSNITLLLSEQVQIRAMAYIDDESKTAHELWEFLNSTYTASNEQAVQNIRVKLDSLVYVEGTEWDEHLNGTRTSKLAEQKTHDLQEKSHMSSLWKTRALQARLQIPEWNVR